MPPSLARWEARRHTVEATILGFQPRNPLAMAQVANVASCHSPNRPFKISFFVGDEASRGVAFDAKTGEESQISSISEGQVRDSLRRLLLLERAANRPFTCCVADFVDL
jgi:hypothetical protein